MLTLMLITLVAFFIGYIGGKQHGRQIGYQLGLAEAPLLLRQKSWESGNCVLCRKPDKTGINAEY